MLTNSKKTSLFILYILGFIFAFTSSLPAYVNSTFLTDLTNEQIVGVFYIISSFFSIISLVFIPKILKRFGNFKVTLFLSILYLLNFIGLAFTQNISLVLFCFMLSGTIATTIYFDIDVFIEHNSSDIKTGKIRSIYLTCINLAWLVSPWIAGMIVEEYSIRTVYLIVAIIIVPIIMIILLGLKSFKDPEYKTFEIIDTIKNIKLNKNIKNIIFSSLLLQMFFSLMVVYTPIYLNKYLGFDWGTIGIILSIMLLPFIFIQIPLGYLADKKFGEKEILTIGFIIMAIFTAIIPMIHSKSFMVIALVLFMTRVGAAMVEVMNDTYFFKQINDKNLNVINIYRMSTPSAYIISLVIATILLSFIPFNYIFYVLAIIMIFALRYSLAIKDTR
jgi:MFS family permease